MNKRLVIVSISAVIIFSGFVIYNRFSKNPAKSAISLNKNTQLVDQGGVKNEPNPLSIEYMRTQVYPGSDIVIEQTLSPGSNYLRYIVSYQSDGLKIYALLTVPQGTKPQKGWPVIVFNHGYIPPKEYSTTAKYVAYTDAFSRNGYIVIKPDFRGNGNSEGTPDGPYFSPSYPIDVLNAVSSIKKYKDANPDKIGMWGHSMGGNITLRNIVVDTKDIKAAVIWGGVVGSYNDLINNWQSRVGYRPAPEDLRLRNNHRQQFIDTYGTPQTNPGFWNSIDPTFFLSDITTPIQLHTGGSDQEVPIDFSQGLKNELTALGKTVEYFNYPGGDHNIASPNFEPAMQRSIAFFDKYLK